MNYNDYDHNEYYSNDDSNHDSDIESRLYAEIYFSHTIEGDEITDDPMTNNELTSNIEIHSHNVGNGHDLGICEEKIIQQEENQNNDVNCSLNIATERLPINSQTNLESSNDIHRMQASNVQTEINLDNSSNINENTNDLINNSIKNQQNNKRVANDDEESNLLIQSSSKKAKCIDNVSNDNLENEIISHSLVSNLNVSSVNCLTDKASSLEEVATNNSITSACVNNLENYVPHSSTENANVLMNEKPQAKKRVRKKKSKATKTTNNNYKSLQNNLPRTLIEINLEQNEVIPNINNGIQKLKTLDNSNNNCRQDESIANRENLHESSTENVKNNTKTVQNNTTSREKSIKEYDSSQVSEVINISSDDSADSAEVKFKFNTITTDKKLAKQNVSRNCGLEDSASDAESIFEVPVPPKPAPPLIELKDSDNEEKNCESSKKLPKLEKKITNNKQKVKETELFNDIILNCTQIVEERANLSKVERLSQISNKFEKHVDVNAENRDKRSPGTSSRKRNINKISNKSEAEYPRNVINRLNDEEAGKDGFDRINTSLDEYFFQPMSKRMKAFYNKSWGGENFDMAELKDKMSNNPMRWAILEEDLPNNSRSRRYFNNLKVYCNRCQKLGHKQFECSEPSHPVICRMCGVRGHYDDRCRNKICLTCGSKQNVYRQTCDDCKSMYCSRCSLQGHLSHSCPDLWRRYHQTISSGIARVPENVNNIMKPERERYCCNCAKKGHDFVSCRKKRDSAHFLYQSDVASYNGPDYPAQIAEPAANETRDRPDIDFRSDDVDPRVMYDFGTGSSNRNRQITQKPGVFKRPEPRKDIHVRIKSRDIGDTLHLYPLENFVLKYRSPRGSEPKDIRHWDALIKFVQAMQSDIPVDFFLNESDTKVFINFVCFANAAASLKSLIFQFVERNNFERRYAYLHWTKNVDELVENLSSKIRQMNKLTDCPLQLYEALKKLTFEIDCGGERLGKDARDSMSKNLCLLQHKLLMILYREGVGDKSLKRLISMKQTFTKRTKKCKKVTNYTGFSVPCLFKFLYNYNNVFASYQPKNLCDLVNTYRERFKLRERIANNPEVFPPARPIVGPSKEDGACPAAPNKNGACDTPAVVVPSPVPPAAAQPPRAAVASKPELPLNPNNNNPAFASDPRLNMISSYSVAKKQKSKKKKKKKKKVIIID